MEKASEPAVVTIVKGVVTISFLEHSLCSQVDVPHKADFDSAYMKGLRAFRAASLIRRQIHKFVRTFRSFDTRSAKPKAFRVWIRSHSSMVMKLCELSRNLKLVLEV